MIRILDKGNCCGCSACAQSCPVQCIEMQADDEGFLYPQVDAHKCVNCGLCEKVCPVLNSGGAQPGADGESVQAFAAYAREDNVRLASSSGGLFTLVARHIIGEQGVVFGAAFDGDFLVHHIGVDSLEGLAMLRGSKYTQSRIENTYHEAKQYLEMGRKVLYSGTACQIAGLKAFLRKDYDNLLTVDVLCHGVPSPSLWELYKKEQEDSCGSKIRDVRFRDKSTGWKQYSVALQFENGQAYSKVFRQDAFMRLFLANGCLRPSCHSCRFKGFPRVSDMTLGDCWGVGNHSPEMDDDRGTSVVIINSKKGENMKAMMLKECVWKEMELNTLLPVTADSRKSVAAHKNRAQIFSQISLGGGYRFTVKYRKALFV